MKSYMNLKLYDYSIINLIKDTLKLAVQCINVQVRNSKDFVPIVHYAYYGGVTMQYEMGCYFFTNFIIAIHVI